MLGLILRGAAGLAGRSGGMMVPHPFITGTVAHVATDGKSTELAMDAMGAVSDKAIDVAGDKLLNGQVLERLGIPTDTVDMLANLGDGMGAGLSQFKTMMGGFMEQIGPLLNTLIAFIVEALGGLVESFGITPAHATTLSPNTSGAPQAIIQGNGRLAADLAASASGFDPATVEGRAALNQGEVFRVPHDGSTDIVQTPVGEMTTPARAERAAANQAPAAPRAPDTALGNRGLNIDDVTF